MANLHVMSISTEVDDCCKPASEQKAGVCPTCGTRGKTVPKITVSVMVKDPALYLHQERLPSGKYFLCENRSCPTVYFDLEGTTIGKENVRVRVWQKEDDPEVPVCYCFRHSISSIADELRRTGNTDTASRITSEVRERNCRCEVTNPQGSCCLGNVAKATQIARENSRLESGVTREIGPQKSGHAANYD